MSLAHPWTETWHRIWGAEKFSRTKFPNDLFEEEISIYHPKISDDLLLVICVSCVFPLYFLCRIAGDPLFLLFVPKFLLMTFFAQFVLCLTSNNSSSQNIGRTDAWAVPHLKFGEGASSQSPPNLSPPVDAS